MPEYERCRYCVHYLRETVLVEFPDGSSYPANTYQNIPGGTGYDEEMFELAVCDLEGQQWDNIEQNERTQYFTGDEQRRAVMDYENKKGVGEFDVCPSFSLKDGTLVTSITVTAEGYAAETPIDVPIQLYAQILPNTAIIQDVEWTIESGTGILTQDGLYKDSLTGMRTIRATAKDGSGVYAEYELEVVAP